MQISTFTPTPSGTGTNMVSFIPPLSPMPRHLPALRRRERHLPERTHVEIQNCWVLNMAQPTQIEVHVQVSNPGKFGTNGSVQLEIVDPLTGRTLSTSQIRLSLPKESNRNVHCPMEALDAEVWEFDNQRVYQLHVSWCPASYDPKPAANLTLEFAFLQSSVEGVGQDAMFRLRNRKLRLRAVIPWSRWTVESLAPMSPSGAALAVRPTERV
jgi:hypothetical protein